MTRLEFELTHYDVAVQHFSYYNTVTAPVQIVANNFDVNFAFTSLWKAYIHILLPVSC